MIGDIQRALIHNVGEENENRELGMALDSESLGLDRKQSEKPYKPTIFCRTWIERTYGTHFHGNPSAQHSIAQCAGVVADLL